MLSTAGVRFVVAAALAVAVPGLAACTSAPAPKPSASTTAQQLQAEPPEAPATAVPDVVTAAIAESDPDRPIYASWPDIKSARALTSRLAATTAADVADFKRDDPVYPNAPVAPEFAGSWDFAGVGTDVIGVRLTQYRFAGTSGATSTKTVWTDLRSGAVYSSDDLFAGHSACARVMDAVVAKAKASGIDPDPAGLKATDLLTSVTFDHAGDLVVTLDQGAITSYDRGVLSVPVSVSDSLLSSMGRTVRDQLTSTATFGPREDARAAQSQPTRASDQAVGDDTATPATAPAPPVDCSKLKCAALTFDDGPGPLTDDMLDLLQRAGVRASFFVLGANAAASPDIVASLCAAGMSVGTEGWDHRDLTRLSKDEIVSQMEQSTSAISSACPGSPTLLRPPYGAYNDTVRAGAGLPLITWTLDPQDWSTQDPATITSRVLRGVAPGAIVDLHENEQATLDAMPAILAGLKARGYTLVSVSELLGADLADGRVYQTG